MRISVVSSVEWSLAEQRIAGKVFISYRRYDDASAAARVRDGLAQRFGKANLFMDVDNLVAGQRFDQELTKALAGRWPRRSRKGLAPYLFFALPRCNLVAARQYSPRRARRASMWGRAMNPSLRRRNWPAKLRRPQLGPNNARQQYERYLARAREAQMAGDVVEMENCYQHAERYLRVMRGTGDERRAEL
jgi:hypothetical protein